MAANQDDLAGVIRAGITLRADEIIAEEITAVRQRVEDRIRKEVGSIAASVMKQFTFERMGTDLVIRVDFRNLGGGK